MLNFERMYEEYIGYVDGQTIDEVLLKVAKKEKEWIFIETNKIIVSLKKEFFVFIVDRIRDKNSRKEHINLIIRLLDDDGIDIFESIHKLFNSEKTEKLFSREDINKAKSLLADIVKEGKHTLEQIPNEVLRMLGKEDVEGLKYVGEHEVEPMSVEADLQKLRQYGVILSRPDLLTIKDLLEKNYYKLDSKERYKLAIEDKPFEYLLELVCEYIISKPVKLEGECYNISVNKFAEIFKLNDLREGELTNFRKRLANLDANGIDTDEKRYIQTNKGRTDILLRKDDNKPARYISFYKNMLQPIIDSVEEKIAQQAVTNSE